MVETRFRGFRSLMSLGAQSFRRKALCALILAWALFDLSVPSICASERPFDQRDELSLIGRFAQSRTLQDLAVVNPGACKLSAASIPERNDRSTDDDCWCCCSHVRPTEGTQAVATLSSFPTLSSEYESPTMGWKAPLLLPPRA